MSEHPAPPGYESFLVGRARVVAKQALIVAIESAMTGVTLHEWASRQSGAQPMQGRATAWATSLPTGDEIVVRHSRHGGLLAPLTGDLFIMPTRAPYELAASVRLAAAGVPTAEVVAYAVYPALGRLARADVVTRLLRGRALPEAWHATTTDDERWVLVEALRQLLGALRAAGAHHPDLNVRNVIVLDSAAPSAAVLDIDRVLFGTPGDPALAELNTRRLLRSMSKEGVGYGVNLTSRQMQHMRTEIGPAV